MSDYATGEIVGRLRHFGKLFGYDVKPLFEDAADEIERLRKALTDILRECDEAPTDNSAWVVAVQRIARDALSLGDRQP